MMSSVLSLLLLAATPLVVNAGTINLLTPPGLYDHCTKDARERFGETTFTDSSTKVFAEATGQQPVTVGIPFSKVNHADENVFAFYLGITAGNAGETITLTQFTPDDKNKPSKGGIVKKSVTVKLPYDYSPTDSNTHFQQIFLNKGDLIIQSQDYLLATLPAGSSIKWAATCNLIHNSNSNNDDAPSASVIYNGALPASGQHMTFTSINSEPNNYKCASDYPAPVFGFFLQACDSYAWQSTCPASTNTCTNPRQIVYYQCVDNYGNTVADHYCNGITKPSNPAEGENCPCQPPETYHWESNCPSDPIPLCDTPRLTLTYVCKNSQGDTVSDTNCNGISLPSNPGQGSNCPCQEQPGGFVLGDPVFSGFHHQSYQVHGLPGAVFNIITHQQLQINARFELIDQGRPRDVIDRIKSSSELSLPDTAAWTHPGTYLAEVSIQTQFAKVTCKAGKYEFGIVSCSADNMNNEKSELSQIGDLFYLSKDQKQYIKRVSSHIVEIVSPVLNMQLVNSDGFFNIESAALSRSVASNQIDGLLGASASPDFKKWTGEEVLQFLVTPVGSDDAGDLLHIHSTVEMFATDFKRNKFQISA